MEIRKLLLMTSVLVIWIISGNLAHTYATGRAAKILEEPIVPQAWNSYETPSSRERTSVKETSDRSLTVENNMIMYRSVFALSLKLLSLFIIFKLFSYGLTSAGLLRPKHAGLPIQIQPLYTVDVNHNPLPSSLLTHTQTSTGAAAGAATGTGLVSQQAVSPGGYITAASSNPRPSFLHRPRFRFGGPRYPPVHPRYPHPPPNMMGPATVSHYNMGEETHLVETHSHVYVPPEGTQSRIPLPITVTTIPNPAKPKDTSSSASSSSSNTATQTQDSNSNNAKSNSDSESSASSSSDSTTERPANAAESVSVSTSSSSSASSAERRSSTVFREKHPPIHHQHYTDWDLHFNPGTRSL